VPTIQRAGDRQSSSLGDTLSDLAMKTFQLGLVVSIALLLYLFWGLFSGKLADAANQSPTEVQQALQTIRTLSLALNVSLVVTLVSVIFLFYDEDSLGWCLVIVGAFLAFGLNYVMEFLFTQDKARLEAGKVAIATLSQLHLAGLIIGAPGILLVLRSLFLRIFSGRQEDLTAVTYGKDAKQEKQESSTIGAFAKCWQLPFCRENLRKKCPIYHARTKCWKEKVGCMCEENVIRLAMGGEEEQKPVDMTKEAGFVPIGDLIQKSDREERKAIPTRMGPRGVRIPTNPHLTDSQKKMRCHNCIIFNEHQRQKYQLLSPLVTLAVPLLVIWQFEALRGLLGSVLHFVDRVVGRLALSGANAGASDLTRNVTGSLPVETILIVCFTLIMMTWALRLLEYCMFKLRV
jgi:hypothetical protein